MSQELRDLVVNEASLVDSPANQHAKVLLWKRDPEMVAKEQERDDNGRFAGGGGSSSSNTKTSEGYHGHGSTFFRSTKKEGGGFGVERHEGAGKAAIPLNEHHATAESADKAAQAAADRHAAWNKPERTKKGQPASSDVHVDAPVGAMKLVPNEDGKFSVHAASGKRVSGPHKDKKTAEAAMTNKRLVELADEVLKLAKGQDEQRSGAVDPALNQSGSGKPAPVGTEGSSAAATNVEGSTDPIKPGDAGKGTGSEEYDAENDIGYAKDSKSDSWYLVDGDGKRVGGPFADKAAAQAAYAGKTEKRVQKTDFDELIEVHQAISEELAKIEKAGAKISSTRLKSLKDVHRAVGAMIKEQDPTYPTGGNLMTDVEKQEAEKAELEKTQKAEQEKTARLTKRAALRAEMAVLKAKMKETMDDDDAEDAADGGDDEDTEDQLKKLDPSVRKLFAKIEKRATDSDVEIRKANDRAAAAEVIAKEERDRRVTVELTEVAKKDLAGLPGTVVEKVARLQKLHKNLSQADYDAELAEMKKAAAAIRTSPLFKEEGATGAGDGGSSTAGSAEAQLEQLAKAKRDEVNKSAGAGAVITYNQAYDLVLNERPELYKQYLKERRENVLHS